MTSFVPSKKKVIGKYLFWTSFPQGWCLPVVKCIKLWMKESHVSIFFAFHIIFFNCLKICPLDSQTENLMLIYGTYLCHLTKHFKSLINSVSFSVVEDINKNREILNLEAIYLITPTPSVSF